ncbi:MAG: citrate synthase [Clostridia bacterium]|nr:citrate synthase [Bacillota bacterium]MBO2521560.1 citrate synthase [Bacillota bacterium]
MSNAEKVAFGLEGVIALETELSLVEGATANLYYRGYHIDDLVEHATYEEVVYLLFNGDLPSEAELAEFKRTLAREQQVPEPVIALLRSLPKGAAPMAMLRTAVSALAHYDPEAEDNSLEANFRKAIRLTAQAPVLVAAIGRIIQGKEPIPPKDGLSIAANFIYMLNGEEGSEVAVKTLDTALILHAEHGLNASTFAGRVTVSTLSDIYSAATSAVGTLKGPLHGGANEAVMKMLLEIGTPDRAESYVREKLARKERIMGIGHRVYKNGDPRVKHLKRLSQELNREKGTYHWVEISERIEKIMQEEKGLLPNVDFYSASAYYALGIPPELYTPIFAASRMSGWTANFLEQYRENRLIRPRAAYVGPRDRKIQK